MSMPDRSQVEVRLNGNPVGTFLPDSFETFALAQLEVPEGLLLPRAEHRRDHGPAYPLGSPADRKLPLRSGPTSTSPPSGIMVPVDALDLGPLSFLAALWPRPPARAIRLSSADPIHRPPAGRRSPVHCAGRGGPRRNAALDRECGLLVCGPTDCRIWCAITAVEPGTDPDTPPAPLPPHVRAWRRRCHTSCWSSVAEEYAEVRSMLVSAAGPVGRHAPWSGPVQSGTAVRPWRGGISEAPVLRGRGPVIPS